MEKRDIRGNIFLTVVFIMVVLGVYVHHLFFLITFILMLLLYGFAKLMDWIKGRRKNE